MFNSQPKDVYSYDKIEVGAKYRTTYELAVTR